MCCGEQSSGHSVRKAVGRDLDGLRSRSHTEACKWHACSVSAAKAVEEGPSESPSGCHSLPDSHA